MDGCLLLPYVASLHPNSAIEAILTQHCLLVAFIQTFGSRPYIVAEGESHTYADVYKRTVLTATGSLAISRSKKAIACHCGSQPCRVCGGILCGASARSGACAGQCVPAGQVDYDCIRDVGCKVALLDVERFRRLRDADEDYIQNSSPRRARTALMTLAVRPVHTAG